MSPFFGTNQKYDYSAGVIKINIIIPDILTIQHHRGCPTTAEQWVLGMVDTSQSPALGIIELVPSHDAATLLPINQQHVRPGTVIWSDEWQHNIGGCSNWHQ